MAVVLYMTVYRRVPVSVQTGACQCNGCYHALYRRVPTGEGSEWWIYGLCRKLVNLWGFLCQMGKFTVSTGFVLIYGVLLGSVLIFLTVFLCHLWIYAFFVIFYAITDLRHFFGL